MARRPIADEDRATFWAAINAGRTIKVASQEAGINYRTGMAWMKKQRDAQPEKVRNAVAAVKADRQKGGKQRDRANEDLAQIELGGPVSQHLLSQNAGVGSTTSGSSAATTSGVRHRRGRSRPASASPSTWNPRTASSSY